jgi:hypothetical protein
MPRGTHFRFTLGEPARVTLKIQRKAAAVLAVRRALRDTAQQVAAEQRDLEVLT